MVAVALARCDHKNNELHAVASAEGFWVGVLQVRQPKIGCKSYFGPGIMYYLELQPTD